MQLARFLRSAYRRAVPLRLRERVAESSKLGKARRVVVRSLLEHNDVYDSAYYAGVVDGPAVASAGLMASTIVEQLRPTSVLDVGCGTGALLAELAGQGVSVTHGLEHSEAGIDLCRQRGVSVTPFDLEARDSADVDETFDVVASMEVGEHLPAKVADRYVDLLVGHVRPGGWLVFTAATPGQGGLDHVNEQPHEYWIEKLTRSGLWYDEARSMAWRSDWDGRVAPWYSANLMVFQRAR
jgi:cyclopropane fatty-acyl-phospholipid synthase-like methyltransferase